MLSITFIGFGNVNYHLFNALYKSNQIIVNQIFTNNNYADSSHYSDIEFINSIAELRPADIIILGIPDDSILQVSEELPIKDRLVVHTSGSVGMEELSTKNRRGVLYPLQTFSRAKELDLSTVPVCIEAENTKDLETLEKLGKLLSGTVKRVDSEERAKLHLAAVFVNNFVNYLYSISEEIVMEENLDFELLKPLILETAAKIQDLSPTEAQTGPAKRNDITTIQKHLNLLSNSSHLEIYKLLNKSIQETYGKKL